MSDSLSPSQQAGARSSRAIIFANGELGDDSLLRKLIEADDFVIAADGGSKHCRALGIQPHLLVGDLDSLDEQTIEFLKQKGTEIISYPRRKDFTDLELALIQAHQRGIKEVLVLAALGNRWDQTLANLLLPVEKTFSDLHVRLIDGSQEIQLLRGGDQKELTGQPGDIVSLIPLSGEASGITTQDLEYPLRNETLFFGSTRGISNVFLGSSAMVFLREGMLVIVVIHNE